MGVESIIVAVAVTAVLVGFIIAYYRYSQESDDFDLKDDLEFIKWLQSYERWYDRSVTWIHWTARICRITPIITGFVIALVSVLDANAFLNWLPQKVLIIALTALSTVCVAVLTQFSLPELEKEREAGRRGFAKLVASAKLFFSVERQPEEVLSKKSEIKDEVFKIEEEQSNLYYDLTGNAKRDAAQHPSQ